MRLTHTHKYSHIQRPILDLSLYMLIIEPLIQ